MAKVTLKGDVKDDFCAFIAESYPEFKPYCDNFIELEEEFVVNSNMNPRLFAIWVEFDERAG